MTVGAVAIGIDFGTAHCCAGVLRNGLVEIIPDDQGQRTMPSFVRFTERQIFVGSAAQSQAAIDPPNTIYDVKRFIGRSLTEAFFKDKEYPFKPDNDEIEVKYKGKKKALTAIKIASILFMRIKENAEAYLGHGVTDAVVSVPAHFTNSQRVAMHNAAEIAGFHVLRLINEPTAAAVAYAFENITRRSNVLVFDLGAGKLDVTILELNNGAVGVKSTAGDPNIGGSDFDTCLVNYYREVFERDNRMSLTDPRALRRLRNACEKAKKELSFSTTSYVQVEPLISGIDFNKLVTRELFERKCDKLFEKICNPVLRALKAAQLNENQIDEILLVGGSTRIPKIQELLTNFFKGKVLNRSVNADEAVAYGAAIVAAKDFDDQTPDLKKIVLVDTIPHTVIMQLSNGKTCNVLKKCTPTAHEECWLIPQPNLDANTTISLFEHLGKNYPVAFVAKCDISGFHRVHEGVYEAELTFKADNSGIVQVTASQANQTSPVIIVPQYASALSKETIEEVKNVIENYKRDEGAQKARIQAKDSCERYARNLMKFFASEDKTLERITVDEEVTIITEANELLLWLGRLETVDLVEIDKRLQELEGTCKPVMEKLWRDIEDAEAKVAAAKSIAGKDPKMVDEAQKMADTARLQYMTFSKLATAPKVLMVGNLQTYETSV